MKDKIRMKKYHIILVLLFPVLTLPLFAQDTSRYCEENAILFSNIYTFVNDSKSDISGSFNQCIIADDGQIWNNKGTFTETKHRILLQYDTTGNYNRLEIISGSDHSDTLYIKWFNRRRVQEQWFTIRYADQSKGTKVYVPDITDGFVKIPKRDLRDDKLSLYGLEGDRAIFTFIVTADADEIDLIVDDPDQMHIFVAKPSKLKKNEKGFKAIGMWSGKRAVQFVKI